jgi:hypothetical protein
MDRIGIIILLFINFSFGSCVFGQVDSLSILMVNPVKQDKGAFLYTNGSSTIKESNSSNLWYFIPENSDILTKISESVKENFNNISNKEDSTIVHLEINIWCRKGLTSIIIDNDVEAFNLLESLLRLNTNENLSMNSEFEINAIYNSYGMFLGKFNK